MKAFLAIATVAICTFSPNSSRANYVIDAFTVGQAHSQTGVGTTTIAAGTDVVGGGMLSGQRDLAWEGTVDVDFPGAASMIAIGSGVLDISNSTTAHSLTTIRWNGPVPVGPPAGFDLTQGGVNDSLYFEYLSDNPVSPPALLSEQLTFKITVIDAMSNEFETIIPVATTFPNWIGVSIPFTAFIPVDFSMVYSIELQVDAPLNRDTTIRFFDARIAAPEPTSLALAGFAGIGMAIGAIRRRRQAKQAA